MKEDIEKLKARFINAESDVELEAIDNEMKVLLDKDIDSFSAGLVECAKETNKRVDELACGPA